MKELVFEAAVIANFRYDACVAQFQPYIRTEPRSHRFSTVRAASIACVRIQRGCRYFAKFRLRESCRRQLNTDHCAATEN
jgi:hypothetical protein